MLFVALALLTCASLTAIASAQTKKNSPKPPRKTAPAGSASGGVGFTEDGQCGA